MKAWIKRHKMITIAAAVIVILLLITSIFFKDETASYAQETAALRDIVTYNSFVGNVEPSTDFELVAQASEEAVSVLVKKGDKVKAGDVIVKLDTTSIDDNIALQEANLSTTQKSNKYNIADAKRNYENYKETIDSGLNSSLESSRMQMESAEKALKDAKEEYEKAKASIDKGTYESIQSVYMQKEQAHRSYITARDSASEAYSYYLEARGAYNDAERDAASGSATAAESKASLPTLKQALASAEAQKNSAERAEDNAEGAYDDALTAFNNAKTNILDKLDDAIESTQISYDNAAKSFEVVRLQVNQQLEGYEAMLEKTEALSDVSAAQIQLQSLRHTRDNYIITAPCDGTVTELHIEKGDMVTMGMPVATIANIDSMQVSIKVDEYAIKNVKVGSPVKIFIDAIEKEYEGRLIEVDKTASIEGGVSYFNAKVSFTPDEDVKSGMSVEVKLTRVNEQNTLSVSQECLKYREDNTAYVYVKNDGGKLVERDIKLGASDGVYVQVIEGLSEGDTVYYFKSLFNMEDMDSMRDARDSMLMGE